MKAYHDSMCVAKHLGAKYVWDGVTLALDDEKREIENIFSSDLIEANRPYYVLSFAWLQAWREYASGAGARPPPINNTELIESQGDDDEVQVRKGLAENYDYTIVPGAVWQRFKAWYGGGPEIQRLAIRAGTKLVVDLFPVEVLSRTPEYGEVRLMLASSNTFSLVRHWCATMINQAPHRCIVSIVTLDAEGKEESTVLQKEQLKQTMEDAGVGTKLTISLETIPQDLISAGGLGMYGAGGRSYAPYRPPESERGEPLARGVVGLYNLGNTCFMNSTLQCLSAVPAFASFFARTERYVELINVDSALGTKGAMTHATTELLHEIWSSVFSLVSPQGFKKVLAKFAGQFHGYQQHDAQEALMVILNLLHEDLTTYGLPEVKGRLPKSPVADLFGGTFRSVVTCDECHTESTIYEPFMNLSLPVPEKERKKINATFFPLDGPPIHIGVRVNKSGNTQHLFHEALVNVLNKPALLPRLVGVHLSGSSCYNLGPAKILNTLREKDQALIYEVQPAADGWLHAHVFSYCAKHGGMDMEGHQMASERFGSHKRGGGGGGGHHSSGHSGGSGKNGPRAFGVPLVVSYKASDSGAQVLERVSACLSMALGWESPLVFRSASVVKFGGEWDPLRPLPLKSTVESDTAIGLLWGSDEADAISKRFAMVQQHASCEPTPEDKEITVPLSSCFELAGAPESLSAGDNWVCPTCRTARSCVKTMSVWRAPPVLCVHLKRFKVDFYLREKLHTLVEFPQELDVSKFVANGEGAPLQNYRLVGVANHVGGLSGGHYTADCLNNDKWYHFDDRKCSETSWEKLVTPSAYVLFYASEESRQLDLPSVEEMALDTAAAAEESVPKKVKAEEKKPDEEPNAQVTEDDDDAAAVAAVLVAKQIEEEQAIRDGAEDNLTGSTYVCDFCSAPVGGGWEGLTRHAKEKHGAEF